MKTDTNHRGSAEGRREPTALVKGFEGEFQVFEHFFAQGIMAIKISRSVGLDPSLSVSAR